MRFGLPRRSKWHDREERAYTLVFIAFVWIAVLGFGLVSVAMVVGIATGTVTDGVYTPTDQYPAFPLLSPTMVVPAVLLASALIMTFKLPLKKALGLNRSEIVFFAFMASVVHMFMFVLDQRFLSEGLLGFVLGVWGLFLAVLVLALLRMVAGWLRLVPESWRLESARSVRSRQAKTQKGRS